MKRLGWFLALSLLLCSAGYAELRFPLDCKVTLKGKKLVDGVKSYRVVKVSVPAEPRKPRGNEEGAPARKWKSRFVVEVTWTDKQKKPTDYLLVPGGDGDEDYSDYDLQNKKAIETIDVQGAAIQNQFKWARLVDVEGYSFAMCQKKN